MDQEIKCIGKSANCEGTFIFTEGEQEYFREKGFEAPKRCKPCRVEHKEWLNKNKGRHHENAPRRRDFRRE